MNRIETNSGGRLRALPHGEAGAAMEPEQSAFGEPWYLLLEIVEAKGLWDEYWCCHPRRISIAAFPLAAWVECLESIISIDGQHAGVVRCQLINKLIVKI